MGITYLIGYSSIIMWLLPPFRQYRGKYFYFFLVLGLEGLSSTLFLYLPINLFKVYNVTNIILILTLINTASIKKYWYLFMISLVAVLIINQISLDNKLIILSSILAKIIIFYIFLKDAAIDYYKNDFFRISYFILLLYEITLILKSYFLYANVNLGLSFFFVTTAFENFIAIFFTIYKVEESPSIKLAVISQK